MGDLPFFEIPNSEKCYLWFMKKWLVGLWALMMTTMSLAQDKPAYAIFNGQGKPLKYKKVLRILEEGEVICFGELHNNPIAHWLELEILRDLTEVKGAAQMVVGAEMLETNQQEGLDQYLKGEVEKKVWTQSTDLWSNHDTDYQPVVDFCKQEGIPFIATNIPRTYARKVSREGIASLDSLPDEEKALMVSLPFSIDFDLPSYAKMKEMMGGHAHGGMAENFVSAQAIKDATMADRILKNWKEGKVFYHMNGSYHSDDKEGILWYVAKGAPDATLKNISVVEQADISELSKEYLGKADIMIVVPNSMTKTYLTGFE